MNELEAALASYHETVVLCLLTMDTRQSETGRGAIVVGDTAHTLLLVHAVKGVGARFLAVHEEVVRERDEAREALVRINKAMKGEALGPDDSPDALGGVAPPA